MRNTISTKLVQSVKKVVVGAAVVFSIWGTALTTTTPVCAARNKGKARVAASKGKAKGKKVSSYSGFSQPTPPIPQPPVQTTAQSVSQSTASQVDAPPTSQTNTQTTVAPPTSQTNTQTTVAPPTSQTNTQTTVVEPPPVAQSNSTSSTQEKQLLALAWLEGFNYLLLGQHYRPGLWNAPGFVEGIRDQWKWWDNWFVPTAKSNPPAAVTALDWNLYFIAYYAPYTKLSVVYQLNSASVGDEFADWLRVVQSNYLLGSYVGAQLNLERAYKSSAKLGDALRDQIYRPKFGSSMLTAREAGNVLRDPNEFLAVMMMMKMDWELQQRQLAAQQQQNQSAYRTGNQPMDFNAQIARQIYEQSGLGQALAREQAEAPMKEYLTWRYLNDPTFRMQSNAGIMQNLYEQLSPQAQVQHNMRLLSYQSLGIPSGLMGDLTNFNTIFAPNADEINSRVEYTRIAAGASQGEAAMRQVYNPLQQKFYNDLAAQANLDQLSQVFGDQIQLKDSLKQVYFDSDPSLSSGY
jgi:hypothetical protein